MPRIRSQFAAHLPLRMERARLALNALREGDDDWPEYAGDLFGVCHDLAGTSSTFGADEMGAVARAITSVTRHWTSGAHEPPPEELEEMAKQLDRLEELALEFLAWMAWDEGRPPEG